MWDLGCGPWRSARGQGKSKGEAEEKAKPEAKMQYNFTDPESRIMLGADVFVQAYNVQIAVEPDLQLIVGQIVTQAPNDKQQLVPAMEAIKEQAEQKPQAVMTDSGYCSEGNLKYLEKKKIEGFIATDRESYRDRQEPGPRGRLPRERHGWTASAGNCRPRGERPSTPGAKRSWGPCLDKLNKREASGNFSCVVWRRCKESGP